MAATIDEYIAAAPPVRAERLTALRAAIHRAAPNAVESIEWKMPVFRVGEHYVAMAAQARYLSVYLGSASVEAIKAATGLKGGKGCLNITDTQPLPLLELEAAFRNRLAGF